jgi:hypothetical protein
VAVLGVLTAWPGAAQRPAGSGARGLELWLHDTSQWPAHRDARRIKLDRSATLEMRVGDTRTLLPVVTGSTPRSNMYLDLCVPVEAFDVTYSPAWPAADPEQLDCARFSSYIPAAGRQPERSPVEPFRFRALAEGAFPVRYRIVTPDGAPVEGEFRMVVGPRR